MLKHLKYLVHITKNMNIAISGCMEFNGSSDMNALLDGTNWLLLRNDGTRAFIGGKTGQMVLYQAPCSFTPLAISIWLLVHCGPCHSTLCPSLSTAATSTFASLAILPHIVVWYIIYQKVKKGGGRFWKICLLLLFLKIVSEIGDVSPWNFVQNTPFLIFPIIDS